MTLGRALRDCRHKRDSAYRNARVVLGTALEYAIEAKKIPANPCRSRILRQRVQRRPWIILTDEETRRLFDAAWGEQYEALYVLAVTTGMRLGEICALRWRDIDLEKGRLKVTGTVNRDDESQLAILPPKTERARRTVNLPEIAIDALRRSPRQTTQHGDRTNLSESALVFHDDDLVFRPERGTLLDGTTVTRHHFSALLRKAGLPHMPFHDLRHTAITHMLEDGVQAHTLCGRPNKRVRQTGARPASDQCG